ncbi:MAG: hypothetical protein WEB59_06260 [Thermoanaerobaculia bacterium]
MKHLLCAASLLLPAVVGGQTIAKQGGEQTEFTSPMVIETPFFMAAVPRDVKETLAWGRGMDPLNRYHCDNVEISDLAMKLKEKRSGIADLSIMVVLHNRPGHDRLVTLLLEAVNGEEVVATASLNRIKVEETDTKQRFTSMTVARDKLVRGTTKLRITITVTPG